MELLTPFRITSWTSLLGITFSSALIILCSVLSFYLPSTPTLPKDRQFLLLPTLCPFLSTPPSLSQQGQFVLPNHSQICGFLLESGRLIRSILSEKIDPFFSSSKELPIATRLGVELNAQLCSAW